ncbi:MAG: hypothetical protein AB7F25_06840 [Deferribacterales bacterium]
MSKNTEQHPTPPTPRIYYNGRFIDPHNPPFDYRHKRISFIIGFIAFLGGILSMGFIISGGAK